MCDVYVCMYVCVYIYIYRERERDVYVYTDTFCYSMSCYIVLYVLVMDFDVFICSAMFQGSPRFQSMLVAFVNVLQGYVFRRGRFRSSLVLSYHVLCYAVFCCGMLCHVICHMSLSYFGHSCSHYSLLVLYMLLLQHMIGRHLYPVKVVINVL